MEVSLKLHDPRAARGGARHTSRIKSRLSSRVREANAFERGNLCAELFRKVDLWRTVVRAGGPGYKHSIDGLEYARMCMADEGGAIRRHEVDHHAPGDVSHCRPICP